MRLALLAALAVSGADITPVAAALPFPTNKTALLQSLLPAKKPLPFWPDKNITTLDDVVATALAIEDHVARSAAALKAAPDAKNVAKWKVAGFSDLKTGERCFGYSVVLSLAMTGPCPSAPQNTLKAKLKPERDRCHPRAVADTAGADVQAAVVKAGDPAATVVVERYACGNSMLTARLYVSAQWPALQAAVPPLSAAVGAGGAAAAAALPTAAERVAACGGGALTTPSSLAVDTSFLVNVALNTFLPGATRPGAGYPVGPLSVQAMYTVGGAQYSTVTDTGSPLVSVPCNTPYAASLCDGRAADALAAAYAPPSSATMGAAECASSTATDCYGYLTDTSLPVQQPACWFAQRLTGGEARYSPEGFYSTDAPLAFSTQTSCQSSPSLAFGATIACGTIYQSCAETDTACRQGLVQCPPVWSTGGGRQPECIYKGDDGTPRASELGWQFAVPYSNAPLASFNSVPTQVLRSGLMARRKLSFCWTQPDTAYNCSAITAPQPVPTYNVLGPARPRAIKTGGGALGTAQLKCQAANVAANTTTDGPTQKFWAHLATLTIQPPANLPDVSPRSFAYAADDAQANTLLDTGAGSQQKVPTDAYNEFVTLAGLGFQQAQIEARNYFRDGIESCSKPSDYCDKNASNNASIACRFIKLRTDKEKADRVTAAQILQASWPTSLAVSFAGGTGPPATMPGAFVRYACDAKKGTLPDPGDDCLVVGCSYVDGYDYAWLAGPFFYRNSAPPPGGPPPSPGGTWTEFDMSGPPPGATGAVCGTMTYASEAVACAY